MAWYAVPRSFVPHLPPAPAAVQVVATPARPYAEWADHALRSWIENRDAAAAYYDAAESPQWSIETGERRENARLLAEARAELRRRAAPTGEG